MVTNITNNKYVDHISDEAFIKADQKIVTAIKKARTERDYYKNKVDPFSTVFEACVGNMDLTTWFESEKARQVQKSWDESIKNIKY